MFSCKYCEISKNTYFEEHLRLTASDTKIFSNHFETFQKSILHNCHKTELLLTLIWVGFLGVRQPPLHSV